MGFVDRCESLNEKDVDGKTHITPPLKRNNEDINRLVDRWGVGCIIHTYGQAWYGAVILSRGARPVAGAETAQNPGWRSFAHFRPRAVRSFDSTILTVSAREALSMLLVPGPDNETVRAATYFNNVSLPSGELELTADGNLPW